MGPTVLGGLWRWRSLPRDTHRPVPHELGEEEDHGKLVVFPLLL